jgi:hypothetical protein
MLPHVAPIPPACGRIPGNELRLALQISFFRISYSTLGLPSLDFVAVGALFVLGTASGAVTEAALAFENAVGESQVEQTSRANHFAGSSEIGKSWACNAIWRLPKLRR